MKKETKIHYEAFLFSARVFLETETKQAHNSHGDSW